MNVIASMPLKDQVAAVSCGLWQGEPVLDLDYDEDSKAQADANFVLTGNGGLVEVQGTAEGEPFSEAQLMSLLKLARHGTDQLFRQQRAAVGIG
jgi:ribonuclease PH